MSYFIVAMGIPVSFRVSRRRVEESVGMTRNFSIAFTDLSKRVAIVVVLFFSHLFRWNGIRACRFHPSCSAYSVEAFERLSFFKALWLTGCRILKCHPFRAGGYDPLPDWSSASFPVIPAIFKRESSDPIDPR